MFFKKINRLERENEQLKREVEIQKNLQQHWLDMWKYTLSAKWSVDDELRESQALVFGLNVKVELLENKLAELEEE